jgi:hypothetical protein
MNYAKNETQTFGLTMREGDEHGCAFYPLTLTWKGKTIPFAISSTIETTGYEARVTVRLAPPKDRGHLRGCKAHEDTWDEMERAGIKIENR